MVENVSGVNHLHYLLFKFFLIKLFFGGGVFVFVLCDSLYLDIFSERLKIFLLLFFLALIKIPNTLFNRTIFVL